MRLLYTEVGVDGDEDSVEKVLKTPDAEFFLFGFFLEFKKLGLVAERLFVRQ